MTLSRSWLKFIGFSLIGQSMMGTHTSHHQSFLDTSKIFDGHILDTSARIGIEIYRVTCEFNWSARSSIGQSTRLRIWGLGVQIPPGAPVSSTSCAPLIWSSFQLFPLLFPLRLLSTGFQAAPWDVFAGLNAMSSSLSTAGRLQPGTKWP